MMTVREVSLSLFWGAALTVEQSVLKRKSAELGVVVQAQLPQEARSVGLDGLGPDVKLL